MSKKRTVNKQKSQAVAPVKPRYSRKISWKYIWLFVALALAFYVARYLPFAPEIFARIDWVLLKDYFAVIITWPTAVFVLSLVFMVKFGDSIRVFLGKLNHVKARGVEIGQQQAKIPSAESDREDNEAVNRLEKESGDGSVTLTKEQADQLVGMFEEMDFKFLNLHLVQNSKLALRIIKQAEIQQDVFMQAYQVPDHVPDVAQERQAILDALGEAGLISNDGGILRATEKGVRFLSFIGMSPVI
jgi:hypothetical protein